MIASTFAAPVRGESFEINNCFIQKKAMFGLLGRGEYLSVALSKVLTWAMLFAILLERLLDALRNGKT